MKTSFLFHYCEVVVDKLLSGVSELLEGDQQVVWRSTNNNTAWCAQPSCEPPSCSCYFLFCCVSLTGKHLVHTWTRDSDDLSVISGWMAATWVPSSPRRLETKHMLRQKELNLDNGHNFRMAKARRQKISLAWRQQSSEPCRYVKQRDSSSFFTDSEEQWRTQTHTYSNPMGQVSTSAAYLLSLKLSFRKTSSVDIGPHAFFSIVRLVSFAHKWNRIMLSQNQHPLK